MGKCTWIYLLTHILRAWGQMIELSPTPCNDKAVEKLSKLALTYINEDRTEGYKFALNRISNVHLHAQGPAGNVYYLRLDVLETKCHVRSPKPWKRCDVRAFMETQISGNCNTTILHTATGYSYLYSYDCTLVPDPPEKLQQICPACPLLLPIDSPRAVHAAGLTLYKFNTQSTLPSSLALQNLTRASVQVASLRTGSKVAPFPLQPAGFCKGAVYGPIGQPDVDVSCEIFHPQVLSIRLQYLCLFELGLLLICSVLGMRKSPFHKNLFGVSGDSSLSGVPDSSSEELGAGVARPPFNFRYRPLRRRRQALVTAKPPHTPVFLAEFPSSPSPFRSCPGPSRYTTV
uniref:Si:ch211-262h13.5 n=1 Tax=Oncorhynchus tshawytscha TaxID=74940 RepID=A0A8C8FM70_ONCTS